MEPSDRKKRPVKAGSASETTGDSALQPSSDASPTRADEAFAADVTGAKDYAEKALSERTLEAYENAWSDFASYCDSVGRESLPAEPLTVAAYLNRRARARPTKRGASKARKDKGLAVSTLEQRLAAIKYVHESRGYRSPTGHAQVGQVLQGIRNDSARQAELPRIEAEPLVSSDLRAIFDVLPGTGAAPPKTETSTYSTWLRGLRDRALLLVGFASSLRPRELVSIHHTHVQREPDGLVIHVPRSKADQSAEGQHVTVLYNHAHARFCPVRVLTRWLKTARIADGPLFRGVKRDGEIRSDALSYRSLNRIVKQACQAAGLTPANFSDTKRRRYSAHSLRAGHVTDAAAGGAPDAIIMMQTRHADPATLRKYDRPAQQLEDSSSGFLGLYRDEE